MSTAEDLRKRNTGQRQNSTSRNVNSQQQSATPTTNTRKNARHTQQVNKQSNTAITPVASPAPTTTSTSTSTPTNPSPTPPRRTQANSEQTSVNTISYVYNSTEVEEMLRRGYDAKGQQYKLELNSLSQPTKTSAWATKSGTMANGKDFWLELRRQVSSLQKDNGVSKGG